MKGLILIYQMGKVGSSALDHTLKELVKANNIEDVKVMHAHFLTDYFVGCEEAIHGKNYFTVGREGYSRHASKEAHEIRAMIAECRANNLPVKIITAARDPIGHSVSSFFENVDNYLPANPLLEKDTANNILVGMYLDLCKKYFSENRPRDFFSEIVFHHFRSAEWFDTEFKEFFGIDIYEKDFNRETGFVTMRKDNIEIFLYDFAKLRDLGTQLNLFLSDLIKTPFEVVDFNTSDGKSNAGLYKEFKHEVLQKIPQEAVNKLYNSKYSNYFGYTFSKQQKHLANYVQQRTDTQEP